MPAAVPVAVDAAPRLAITVNTDPKTQNRVLVELRFDGPLAAGAPYPFRPTHDVKQTDVKTERVGPNSVRVRYTLDFAPALDAAEAIEMKAAGEDIFALPDDDDRIPVDLKLTTGGVVTNAISTFGIGTETHFEARPSDLRSGYYVAGDIGTAVFHAADGNDFAGWIDHTAFDSRWVAAVSAATRGAVDAWVGRERSAKRRRRSASSSSRRSATRRRSSSPTARTACSSPSTAARHGRRARASSSRRRSSQRYVGGFLWVGNRDREQPGWFWSDGFSRAIAREVLYENGALDGIERAKEMNDLLAASTFATEPRDIALARGALVATAFDVAARKTRQ